MKKEDFIKLGIADEIAQTLAEASAEELKGFIPKSRFDEVNTALNTAKADIATRDGQLETLKNSTGDVEALKGQIATLQTDNKAKDETHAKEIKELKVNSAIDAALTAAKAKNSKAVKALLDINMEKLELGDDGVIKGLDEQIKKLQGADDSRFLFDTDTKKSKIKGAAPGESGKEDSDEKVDVTKMSYEELDAYMKANPDAQI